MIPKISLGSFELKLSDLFFYILVLIAGVMLFLVIQPFITVIIFVILVAIFFYPWYKAILKLLKGREKLASFLTALIIILLIIIPLILFTFIAAEQAIGFLSYLLEEYSAGRLSITENLATINDRLNMIPLVEVDLSIDQLLSFLQQQLEKLIAVDNGFSILVSSSQKLFQIFEKIAIFVFLLFGVFPLLKDAKQKIAKFSPLPDKVDIMILTRLAEMMRAVFVGIVVVGLVQAVTGGIGLLITGIPAIAFWMLLMIFLAIIPMLGVGFVLVPIILTLLLLGNLWQAFVLFGFYVLAINIDNYLRPMLVGKRTSVSPLLLILAIFGGLKLFGIVGILFGPMILVFFISLIEAYEQHYLEDGKK